MGNCKHCKKEITLKDSESYCPNCNMPPYSCWNCREDIVGNEKECKICGFFHCNNCGVCGYDCKYVEHLNYIKGKNYREIIEYFYNLKLGNIRKNCMRGVPISYAKTKLVNSVLKLKGIRVRNEEDRKVFESRFDKMLEFPIGKTWTINKERENGFYGNELREISNLLICLGNVKKTSGTTKNGKEYDLFERIEGELCPFAQMEKLIIKQCPKCKKNYPLNSIFCDGCKYIKGKNKGLSPQLKERRSKIDFCQLQRIKFKIKKEE